MKADRECAWKQVPVLNTRRSGVRLDMETVAAMASLLDWWAVVFVGRRMVNIVEGRCQTCCRMLEAWGSVVPVMRNRGDLVRYLAAERTKTVGYLVGPSEKQCKVVSAEDMEVIRASCGKAAS